MSKLIFTAKDIKKIKLRSVGPKYCVYSYNTQLIQVLRNSYEDTALSRNVATHLTLNLWNGKFYIANLITKKV